MAGKHESGTATATEPSWRPFAQKLSGFMRHGSTKNRKVSPSQPVVNAGDDKISVFKLGRNKSNSKSPAAETTLEFKPLEVDISKLESMRLAEGWLEVEKPKKPDPEQLKKKPLPKPPPSSATPIADLFASKSEYDLSGLSGQDRSRRHTHMFLGGTGGTDDAHSIARKPVPTSPAATTTTTITSTTATTAKPPATHAATYSILERGRPIEPKDILPADPADDTTTQSSIPQKRRSLQSSQSNVPPPSSWSNATGASKFAAAKNNDNRHSMFAIVPTPTGNTRIDVGSRLQTPRSASATPLDRIQAWQKSITSAPVTPTAAGSMAPPPAPNAAAAALGTPQPAASVRKVSPRGLAGNRLAWIRELEEKKSSDLRKDVGVLKKQAGSVSDKLAMFENKGVSGIGGGGVGRLPPLSRSNSTTSRMSSVGLKSTTTSSAWDAAAATPRTSIDTTRSSHRNSGGVMSYYDESFREKMEGLVAAIADKDDEEAKKVEAPPRKRRITASFHSVEGGKKAAAAAVAATAAERDAKPEEQEPKKEEEPVAAEAPVAAQEDVAAPEAEATKTEEAEVEVPAVEATEVDVPVVEAEKVEETPEPAQVEEVTPEVSSQTDEVAAAVEEPKVSEPEVVAPEVAEEKEVEKVAEQLPSQEEPVVSQPEPEVATQQAEPVEQVAETVVSEPAVSAPEPVVAEEAVAEEMVPVEMVPVFEESQTKELVKDEEAPVPVQVQEETPEAGAKIDI
ncbi:hypothetical protein PG999_007541 [Apiospora kogelbergensis]|uniref:Uncharacterized protein n=1 Tax=Apiospora kogelbergensis TaxID=1337665 RepID=A0AAW0QSL3_9PEZI